MHVFLIGFMGAGKTTLGQKAAAQLGWPFLDLDEWIETQQNRSIQEIFAQDGEHFFRKLEGDALTFLGGLTDQPHVISTGGGLPCHGEHMDRLLEMGQVIYLKVEPATLVGRLRQMRAERPMLNEVPDHELGNHVRQLLGLREPYYSRADYVLSGPDLKASSIVDIAQKGQS